MRTTSLTSPSVPLSRLLLPGLILILPLLAPAAHAAEIDSVTPRAVSLPDAATTLNALVNQRLAEGVEKANLLDRANQFDLIAGSECNRETLYTELRKALFQSLTASWGLKGYALDQQLREALREKSYHLSLNDSVYRDLDYLEAFSLRLKELSDVVRVGGHLVGIDKFGHFFAEGWEYFERTRDGRTSLQAAMDWGRQQEEGKFGYLTTGIFSFADLTANLHGWRFWNRVLMEQNDPLQGRVGNLLTRPYVRCAVQWGTSLRERRWVRAWELERPFDITAYVDAAWDEGQNCNSYADPLIEGKIVARQQAADPDFHCPLDSGLCVRLTQHYDDLSRQVLHPACLTAASGAAGSHW